MHSQYTLASFSLVRGVPATGCSAFSNSFFTFTIEPSSSDVWEETSSWVVSPSSLLPGTCRTFIPSVKTLKTLVGLSCPGQHHLGPPPTHPTRGSI